MSTLHLGRVRSRQTTINSVLTFALLTVVALSPVPLGSVSAMYWAVSASVVGVIALLYGLALLMAGEPFRIGLRALWPQVLLFALTCAYLLVQILPLGQFFGAFTIPVPQGELQLDTISITPGMTILMLMRQLGYGVFFFLVLQCAYNEHRRLIMLDVLLGITVVHGFNALISLLAGDLILGFPKWAYAGAATGTFVNRNSLATFLALGACIAAAQAGGLLAIDSTGGRRPHGSWLRGLFYILAFALLIVVIVASQSRMGLFAALSGSAIAFACTIVGARNWRGMLAGLGAVIVALLVGMAWFGDQLFERLLTTERSAVTRTDVYQQVIELIAARPWLGYGGGSFELAFPIIHHPPVNTDLTWDRAHNTYLALWSELGVVFGSLPILLVILTTIALILRLSRAKSQPTRVATAAAIAGIVAVAAHSLVDFSLEIQAVTYLFLALLATGSAAAFDDTRKRKA